jgi:hypothetical protein
VAIPTVAFVTDRGVRMVPEKDVMEDVAQVLLNKMGIHIDLARALVRRRRGGRR